MRAQTTLPSVAVALVLLTIPAVLGVVIADGSLVANERPAVERQTTVAVSDRLVSQTAPVTHRANVLDESKLRNLSVDRLRTKYGVPDDASIAVALGDETLVATDDVSDWPGPDDGSSVERIVHVANETERTIVPTLTDAHAVTLPRRTANGTIDLSPGPDGNVSTVRANGRVVLHDEDGLEGAHDVRLSRYETTTLTFDVEGDLAADPVSITFRPLETYRSRLVVTLDA